MLWSCTSPTTPGTPDTGVDTPLDEIPETSSITVPHMDGDAWIVRTTAGIPYIYASTREDLARATGFVLGVDRFFMIDMERRLAEGRIAEVLGDSALAADLEARGIGMSRVTDQLLLRMQHDTAFAGVFDAYAEGLNAYVSEVNANRLPVPSEYAQLGPLIGHPDPKTLLGPFTRRDMAAIGATLIYQLGFEDEDLTRAESWAALDGLFAGATQGDLRQAGAEQDLFWRVEPVWDVSSAPGFGTAGLRSAPTPPRTPARGPLRVERQTLARLTEHTSHVIRWFGKDRAFGSNAWAVDGAHTTDGRAILSGDGHLPLSVPSLFYQVGLDTSVLGDGEISQVGLAIPGLPMMAVGTNGRVAWSQTALYGDITDWYTEELTLDAEGRPASSLFQGEQRALVGVDESYVIANVPILGSIGRTETWTRYETFDGRPITQIEGRLAIDEPPGPGEVEINVLGERIVPGDVDGDGRITAISVDHAAFDDGNLMLASDGFGHATDVRSFREATRRNVAYSQNLVVADADGSILYTGYQPVPCRGYLDRQPDGSWADGANPQLLLDGTRYRGFSIPVNPDGTVDESHADDPYRCVVPFDVYPQNLDPEQGYVLTANNDIGNLATDGSLTNDDWYIGGPWVDGYRAKRIDERLAAVASTKTADIAAMSDIQADHRSMVGEMFLPPLLAALDEAERVAGGHPAPGSSAERMAAIWTNDEAALTEVRERLVAWQGRGLWARSGVKTFYADPSADDVQDAVATTLFNHWISEVVLQTFEDEGLPYLWWPDVDTGQVRALKSMLDGRDAENSSGLASWDPTHQESVFFDDLATPEVETSDELIVRALASALDALRAPPSGPGTGGFGTDDMDQWLWGYRHMVQFQSLLAQVMSPDDDFGFLIDLFSITPRELPLDEGIPFDDPRAVLPWFPRDGDQMNVDAGDPNFTRDDWMYASGPVFRMVIALGPDGPEGVNVLPGGQSGLVDSPHFADQAALWLGNQTLPLLTTPEAVAAAAEERITLHP